jgi:hypothetical protein
MYTNATGLDSILERLVDLTSHGWQRRIGSIEKASAKVSSCFPCRTRRRQVSVRRSG